MSKQPTYRSRLHAYAALLVVAIVWGVAGPVIKYTLNFIPPFLFLFLRLVIATTSIIPFLIPSFKKIKLTKRQWQKLIMLGFLGTTVTLSLFFVGFNHTSAIEGALLSVFSPILIVIGGSIFLKEEVTKKETLGLIIAILGSLIITLGPRINSGSADSGGGHLLGNSIIIIANISWATYTLWSKKLLTQRVPPLVQTGISFAVGTVTSLPLAVWEWWTNPSDLSILTESFAPWSGILYMSIFSSVIAYFLYEWGFEKIEASEATLFAYLQPLFTLPAAYIILGEVPHRWLWIGAVVIGAGVVITEHREKPKNRRSR